MRPLSTEAILVADSLIAYIFYLPQWIGVDKEAWQSQCTSDSLLQRKKCFMRSGLT